MSFFQKRPFNPPCSRRAMGGLLTLALAALLAIGSFLTVSAAELQQFTLSSKNDRQLTVSLQTDTPVTVQTEVLSQGTGHVVHLKNTRLSQSLIRDGLPVVVDSANRFIGRVVRDGADGVKIIIPNASSKISVQVVQKTHPHVAQHHMLSANKLVPLSQSSASTQQALKGQFKAAAKAAMKSSTAGQPSAVTAAAVESPRIKTPPQPRPEHRPSPRLSVGHHRSSQRVTHVTLPTRSSAQAKSSTSPEKKWMPVTRSVQQGLPQVVPMQGAGVARTQTLDAEELLRRSPGQIFPNWAEISQLPQGNRSATSRSIPTNNRSWFQARQSKAEKGTKEIALGWQDGTSANPYGLVAQDERLDLPTTTTTDAPQPKSSWLGFMDQVTGDQFSKPYGVAFWGLVMGIAFLGCLGFLALAIGALCARFIFSPPSVTVSSQSSGRVGVPWSQQAQPLMPEDRDPLIDKYTSDETSSTTNDHAAQKTGKREGKREGVMNASTAGDANTTPFKSGFPMGNPTSLYASSPIGRWASPQGKKPLLRQAIRRRSVPRNVSSAIEQALKLRT